MAAETKNRKFIPPPPRRKSPSLSETNDPSLDPRIQRAKNKALSQAQQDGTKGNFRIFDSPFGNFMLPVIPTRAELAG